MKANHNAFGELHEAIEAVLAVSKVLNLKANHNTGDICPSCQAAVLAVSKVLNLKANHNYMRWEEVSPRLY